MLVINTIIIRRMFLLQSMCNLTLIACLFQKNKSVNKITGMHKLLLSVQFFYGNEKHNWYVQIITKDSDKM